MNSSAVRAALLAISAIAFRPIQADDWPQFLGLHRNGVYTGRDILNAWPAEPRVAWQRPVGAGFSGPVVAQGRIILFHRVADHEVVECLDAATHETLWTYRYPTNYRDSFGFDEGPRATPTIADGRVFTFGAEGMLHCFDFHSGAKLWAVDTHRRFRVPQGFFGAVCSPLVEDGRVLLAVGGRGAGVVAFDAGDGRVLWQATDHEAGYSSPVAATIAGRRHALCFTRTGLVDLDPAVGRVRFEHRWRARSNNSVNAATPLVIDGLVFLSASYQTGATLLRINETGVDTLWGNDESLSCHYATAVHHDGFLYGIHGRQEYGASLRCVELRTGKVRWSEDRFGSGSLILAGDRLLIAHEDGRVLLVQATPERYELLGEAKVLPRTVRAGAALADGRLYLRNETTLATLDLRPNAR